MASFPEQPEIDFLILADKAEAINGKLYLMGGAWDRLFRREFTEPVMVSLAMGILIPWGETNKEHSLIVSVEHEDGRKVAPDLQMGVNVGRPPSAVPGQSFRATIAIDAKWPIPGPGTYRVVATLANRFSKRAAFYVERVGSPRPEDR